MKTTCLSMLDFAWITSFQCRKSELHKVLLTNHIEIVVDLNILTTTNRAGTYSVLGYIFECQSLLLSLRNPSHVSSSTCSIICSPEAGGWHSAQTNTPSNRLHFFVL